MLRDRRFGRQILHVMSREALGWPPPKAHLAPFDALERHSILEMEPPEHTRLRNLVNRAFVSRQVEKLAPRIAALAHERIDAFERDGSADLIEAFAAPIPVAVIADLLGVPRDLGPKMLDWSHRMVAMYQFGVTRAVEESAAAASRDFADFMRAYARARPSGGGRRRPALPGEPERDRAEPCPSFRPLSPCLRHAQDCGAANDRKLSDGAAFLSWR